MSSKRLRRVRELKNEMFIVSDKKLIELSPSENLEELRSF